MTDQSRMALAELRFFRDLVDAERMKVFKAFDLLPQDHDERLPHGIQRKMFNDIAALSLASARRYVLAGYQWLHHSPMSGDPMWIDKQFYNGQSSKVSREIFSRTVDAEKAGGE